MSTKTSTDYAETSQYVTDPGKEHGFTVDHALSVWQAFRHLPASEQIVYRDSEEFKIMQAYMDPAETFEEFTGQQQGKLFANHCIPSLVLQTPPPEWATNTDEGFNDAEEPSCLHHMDVDTGDALISAAVQRHDIYERATGKLTIGKPFVTLDFDRDNDEYTADDLRKIAAAAANAADELESVQQAS